MGEHLIYTPKVGPNAGRYGGGKKKKSKVKLVLDFIIVALVACATFVMFKLTVLKTENQEVNNSEVVAKIPEEKVEEDKGIDLQPLLNRWKSTMALSTKTGVYIIDLDNDNKVLGKIDSAQEFPLESLYKLFVVFEGYRRVEGGLMNGDETIVGDYSVNKCLDLAMRESNSACAEKLLDLMGGEEEIARIARDNWGLQNTNITSYTSTAEDVVKMLTLYYEHKNISDKTWVIVKDSMLNQPPIESEDCINNTCDFRQGLPSGFSDKTKVYNKVGWKWNTAYWEAYNDAAILEFPKYNKHFAIAVLTNGFTNTTELNKLGALIEEALNAYLESGISK